MTYDYCVSDIIILQNTTYISNQLHDYFLNNFFCAFAMGLLLGVVIGLCSESLNLWLKHKLLN